ncbi:hypothetical protein [Blackfly microvirus SF02]|uniref:Uncharacterized protein n=1 Tax=Blackfly microvirus SF02 TaxID=2576452 RepID=A0A4P8PSY0_9VIRU|nr:hypothetical protein [Blackfly microvirus SF02]
MTIRTQYQGNLANGEINLLPSKTVPDQSMSIGEIMHRYASGLPVGGTRVPMYEEDEDPEYDTMPHFTDKMEALDYMRENKKRIEQMQDDLGRQQKKYENVPSPGGGEGAGGKEKIN